MTNILIKRDRFCQRCVLCRISYFHSLPFTRPAQLVHEKVQTQKEHYLNYRKFILDDDSDVFASSAGKTSSKGGGGGGGGGGGLHSKAGGGRAASLAATGPPPFGSTFAQKSTMASIFAALQATQAPPPNSQPQV